MLRDRIVLGTKDRELQERMLRIRDLDLSKAADMCKAAELVKTQTRDLQEGRSVDIVKKKDKTNSVKNEGDKVKQSDSENLNPLGIINLKCSHDNIQLYEDFVVVNNTAQPLLGLDTCVKLNLIKKVSINSLVSKSDFIDKNLDVFEGLGKFDDLPGVFVYFDDILVSGETEKEHDRNLEKVIKRAKEKGIKFNKNKLQYRVKEVTYLGHKFSEMGVRPDDSRVAAIVNIPSQLLMSRITRTKIPIAKSLLKPKVESNIEPTLLKNQDIYKMYV
ncbi:Reverse transcriptase (RNA-dependent DNA polymerase) [Popillia japonica]|uniref:Reverse transcriptase (RNA-dependent DNA polymerase) n=1 Tax=Popillia japonica TaxID=7064 RepID=A0AAW1M2M9_POPJA